MMQMGAMSRRLSGIARIHQSLADFGQCGAALGASETYLVDAEGNLFQCFGIALGHFPAGYFLGGGQYPGRLLQFGIVAPSKPCRRSTFSACSSGVSTALFVSADCPLV